MNPWLAALQLWLVDFYLLATALLLLAAAGARWFRQPVERLEWCRALTFALAAVAALTLLPGWPKWGLRADRDEVAERSPVVRPVAEITANVDPAAEEAAKLDEAFAAIDALLGRPPQAAPQVAQSLGREIVAEAAHAETPSSRLARALPVVPTPQPTRGWRFWLSCCFALGSGCAVLWLLLGALQTAWLRFRSSTAPAEFQALLREVVGSAKPPRLALSGRLAQPVALGVLRPGVLLPRRFAQALPEEDLRAVLAHEWAHIRRGDLLLLAVSRGLLPLLFAHPLFWWLRARMRIDQELVADASAAGEGAAVDYAERLLQWTRLMGGRRGAAAALALGARPSQLKKRIEALLDPDFRVEVDCPRRCRWGAWTAAGLATFVLSLVTLRPPLPAAPFATGEAVEFPPAVSAMPANQAGEEHADSAAAVASLEEPLEDFDPNAAPRYRWTPVQSAHYTIRIEAELENGLEIFDGASDYLAQTVTDEGATLRHSGALFPRSGFSGWGFPFPTGDLLQVDERGTVSHSVGNSPLPYCLGDLANIVFDPLPAEGEVEWQATSERALDPTAIAGDTASYPFAAPHHWAGDSLVSPAWPGMLPAFDRFEFPRPSVPYGPHGFGPRGYLPRGFGPPDFGSPDFGPRFGRTAGTLLTAEVRQTYRLQDSPGRYARIVKEFELATVKRADDAPPADSAKPLYRLSGSGTIEFDRARGLPRSVVLEARLIDNTAAAPREIPVRFSAELAEPGPAVAAPAK